MIQVLWWTWTPMVQIHVHSIAINAFKPMERCVSVKIILVWLWLLGQAIMDMEFAASLTILQVYVLLPAKINCMIVASLSKDTPRHHHIIIY